MYIYNTYLRIFWYMINILLFNMYGMNIKINLYCFNTQTEYNKKWNGKKIQIVVHRNPS